VKGEVIAATKSPESRTSSENCRGSKKKAAGPSVTAK